MNLPRNKKGGHSQVVASGPSLFSSPKIELGFISKSICTGCAAQEQQNYVPIKWYQVKPTAVICVVYPPDRYCKTWNDHGNREEDEDAEEKILRCALERG